MTNQCPNCGSIRITEKGYARRSICAIGTIAGAILGATGAASGAELGAIAGSIAGPPGIAIGGMAGAVLSALICGATGASAGATLGEIVDKNILDNQVCIACNFSFGEVSGYTSPFPNEDLA